MLLLLPAVALPRARPWQADAWHEALGWSCGATEVKTQNLIHKAPHDAVVARTPEHHVIVPKVSTDRDMARV